MNDPVPQALARVIPAHAQAIWWMLAEDSGCSVTVFDQEARIIWANERVLIDYEWHLARRHPGASGVQLDPYGKRLSEIVHTELGREREHLVIRTVRDGRPIVYESYLRGVRQRVVIHPLGTGNGGTLAVGIARRLRATERIEELVPAGAILVLPEHQDLGPLSTLSARELEVLRMVGEGLSSHEIARRLHRSVRTIEVHRSSIGEKLGMRKGSDLVRVAIRAGLSEMPDEPDLLKDQAPE